MRSCHMATKDGNTREVWGNVPNDDGVPECFAINLFLYPLYRLAKNDFRSVGVE